MTARNTGQMPRRSDKPGLKWRRRADGTRKAYWVAAQVTRDSKHFPAKTIALPAEASDTELGELCEAYTARFMDWLGRGDGVTERPFLYDGTVKSLSRVFQTHLDSPFHEVKRNTRDAYTDSLKIIESTVGDRLIRKITIVDVRRWWKNWRAPKTENGPDRKKRAHDCVSVLRMILRFGAALGFTDCEVLVTRLAMLRFERPGTRDQELRIEHVVAFVKKAIELGKPAMAIGVAAQFELMCRQRDLIGEWAPARPKIPGALYSGTEMWTGHFRWDNVPGWRLRFRTSKNRAPVEFDLTRYPLLFPLLEAVPHSQRVGAIVKGEHGLPVRERTYRKHFRAIARAAAIPDAIWSMDARAGAATEADEAGADFKGISDHLTHAEPRTTMRYIRRSAKRVRDVADARARARTPDNSDG
jgi:hypothetical protein